MGVAVHIVKTAAMKVDSLTSCIASKASVWGLEKGWARCTEDPEQRLSLIFILFHANIFEADHRQPCAEISLVYCLTDIYCKYVH